MTERLLPPDVNYSGTDQEIDKQKDALMDYYMNSIQTLYSQGEATSYSFGQLAELAVKESHRTRVCEAVWQLAHDGHLRFNAESLRFDLIQLPND